MRKSARALLSLVAGATMVGAAPGMVEAVTSYQGSDYSYDYNSRKYIAACDQEADQTPVKGVYDMNAGSDGEVKDSDGSGNSCATKNPAGTTSNYITRHKTCEYRSFWPDECGNWQAT